MCGTKVIGHLLRSLTDDLQTADERPTQGLVVEECLA